MSTKEKVRFGLKNVHYAVWDDTTNKFGTPVPWPGAVSLSISPEGDTSTFYADDKAYYTVSSNGGYTGTLETAAVQDDALTDLLGYVTDANGMVIEDADAVAKQFALLYEVDGNMEPTRFVMYNCSLARPSGDHSTKSDSSEPDTESVDITCITRTFTYGDGKLNAIKGHLSKTTESAKKYEAFFNDVMVPTKASA